MSIGLQYQSSFYKPKTYKDMEETLFKLTRAITDTGTDTVSSKGGTVTYRITSLKRKLVNGKVVSTSTPSCTLGSASVSWAIWGGVTVGDGYLDVKINYSENTGSSSRSTTLIFTQNGSNNKINLTVTQLQFKDRANITISVSKSSTSNTTASCDIISDKLVASEITFRLQIQYGVSSGDVKEYIYTLAKGSAISRNNTFAIQDGANPQVVEYGYSPREDSTYIYTCKLIQ